MMMTMMMQKWSCYECEKIGAVNGFVVDVDVDIDVAVDVAWSFDAFSARGAIVDSNSIQSSMMQVV